MTKQNSEALALPVRSPQLSEAQKLALIERHLGLTPYRNNCVIDNRSGIWTDAERYFDLIDAAITLAREIQVGAAYAALISSINGDSHE